MRRFKNNFAYFAQQMSEYSIVIALIAVSLIVALSMFGTAISNSVQSMVADMNRPAPGPLANAQSAGPAIEQPSGQLSNTGQIDMVSQLPMTYNDNSASAQETTGANGATVHMSEQLLSIGKQQLAAGEISQEQYNLFEKLANTGHQMAAVEGMIESAAAKANSYDEFMNTPVVHDGQNMTIGRLTDYMGTSKGLDSSNPLSYSSQPSKTLEIFIDAYNELKSSGALSNSAINQQVTGLSNNIAELNDTFDNVRLKLQAQSQYSPDALKTLGASYISNTNSTKICEAGGTNCKQ